MGILRRSQRLSFRRPTRRAVCVCRKDERATKWRSVVALVKLSQLDKGVAQSALESNIDNRGTCVAASHNEAAGFDAEQRRRSGFEDGGAPGYGQIVLKLRSQPI